MKTGLVLEGGAMRALFSVGVMDVMMEQHVEFDGAIGVSAGAAFGCNYKSHQPERALRYNLKYCRDPRYCSFRSLIQTGDLFGADFCYHEIPEKLDPFDEETFNQSPMEFHLVCTDLKTGRAVYHPCDEISPQTLEWMRASASMPLASRIVEIDGYKLLDGGIADSIPLRYFEQLGYTRNVVVLTQPPDYVKQKNKALPLIRFAYRKYPKFIEAAARRHLLYNAATQYVREKARQGEVFVIQPEKALPIGHVEHHPEKLQTIYQIGRQTTLKNLEALKQFLNAPSKE